MNEKEKKEYLEGYKKAKENGVPFFPDIIFKDVIVSLLVFILLAALAYFLGVPTEARANPNDATYTPRPEWYFLFLFQLLKYFPGQLEVIGVVLIPGLFILLLFALPFIDKNPKRHFLNRPLASVGALAVVAGIVGLTVLSVREAPPPQVAAQVDQAAALYAQNCANCHGPTIDVPPATDLHQLIAQGKHEGMPAWGGDLSTDRCAGRFHYLTERQCAIHQVLRELPQNHRPGLGESAGAAEGVRRGYGLPSAPGAGDPRLVDHVDGHGAQRAAEFPCST
jgi:cytochrome c553